MSRPVSFDDAEIEHLFAVTAPMLPWQRDAFLRTVAGALAHNEHCEDRAFDKAIALAMAARPLVVGRASP